MLPRIANTGRCSHCCQAELLCFCWADPQTMHAFAEEVRRAACLIRAKLRAHGKRPAFDIERRS